MPHLISENQGGFLSSRSILNNIILVQEAIHSSFQSNLNGMATKLDLENSFDRVSHSFIFQIMRSFGFGNHFINQITTCISSPWITPLLNGWSTAFFQSTRGLTKGLPLSPFLYILMEDSIRKSLEKKRQISYLSGITISRGFKTLNHSQFVDDTIKLGGASTKETFPHLFLECNFIFHVQEHLIQELNIQNFVPPENWKDMFLNWTQHRVIKETSNQVFKNAWNILPKFIMWKTWLARNSLIFQQKQVQAQRVAIQDKSMMLKSLIAHGIESHLGKYLSMDRAPWLKGIHPSDHKKYRVFRPLQRDHWAIRLFSKDMEI